MYQLNIIKKINKDYKKKKKLVKDTKIILKKKTKKSNNMVMNVAKNLSEYAKQKLVEYRKKCSRMRKSALS